MGRFYLILFSRGKNWTPDQSDEVAEIQRGHSKFLNDLHNQYRAVAGPFEGGPEHLSGMTLLPIDQMSEDEINQLIAQDPAIKAGRLSAEVLTWHTPPGFVVLG